jgi:hypothetical protein
MRQSVCRRTASFTAEVATASTPSIRTGIRTTIRLLPSPSQTLAGLVAAAVHTERPHLAQIGRGMASPITDQRAVMAFAT